MSQERLELALALSKFAHAGQTDKAGSPYYLHPLHVSSQVQTEDEKIAALLHDVLEDSNIGADTIRDLFGETVYDAVFLLTRQPGEPYEEYIAGLADNPIARAVKIADLEHNMDLTRLQEVQEKDRARVEKYRRAHEYLTSL